MIADYTESLFGIRIASSDNIVGVPVPSSPTRPALKQRYERRHDELVRQAAREFARRGYDQTTMQELAASMGLATGALYHYFASKEDLLRAVCDQLMEPLLVRARELTASAGRGRAAAARAGQALGRARRRAPRSHAGVPAGAPRDRVGRAVARGA